MAIVKGVYYGKTDGFYNEIEAYRSTQIKKALKGPEYYHLKDKFSTSMNLGIATHQRILEPDTFNFEVKLDGRTKEGRQQKESGVRTLTTDEFERMQNMSEAFFSNPHCQNYFENTRKEVIAVSSWWDHYLVKAKADMLGPSYICDVKTTSELPIDQKSAYWLINKYNYHLSAAFYLDVFQSQLPDHELAEFIWIFLESKEPFKVVVVKAERNQDLLLDGKEAYEEALQRSIRYDHNNIKKEHLLFQL